MKRSILFVMVAGVLASGLATASSHREAPLIAGSPKLDGTDFYMFRSYESGRSGNVTFIANYQPLQDAYGGPNYFLMNDKAIYEIHIDNNHDAKADLTFRFQFNNNFRNKQLNINGQLISVPLSNIGSFGGSATQWANSNYLESYSVKTYGTDGKLTWARNLDTDGVVFIKPYDNIGNKSIPDYRNYSARYVSRIGIDGCASQGRVFVGQRKDPFVFNLGEVFDLVNTNPVGPVNGETDALADKNVTSIALEVPISCLTAGSQQIIGAWTTASLPYNNRWAQVSRLSAPLVNELVIGLQGKDRFNSSLPQDDGQFAKYVTNPTLPALLQALYPSVTAPTAFPRTDLVAAFLTGVDGLNKPANVTPSEMMRLNTSTAVTAAASQNNLGVIAGDNAGFPNGRRPGDDVIDIELRVAMGVLLPEEDAPSGQLPFTDGVTARATDYPVTFPYLNAPLPGSPAN